MMILNISLPSQTYTYNEIPENWRDLGGRGLTAQILLDLEAPTCDPLGPENPLVFAPGLLTGFRLPCMDRLSIGAKSPLTGGIKESNAGGQTAVEIAALGLKAIIIHGQAAPGWVILHIGSKGVMFEPAGEWVGLGVYETGERLKKRYGKGIIAAIIGPGGENQYLSAGIQNMDKDGIPSRMSARGGLGAVMGSKKIKAIIFQEKRSSSPQGNDRELAQFRKSYTKKLLESEFSSYLAKYGTAGNTLICNQLGALPTRNFSTGSFEGAEKISGERMYEIISTRKGNTSHSCTRGCVIRCSNIYPDEGGNPIVSPLEYETIGLVGSNLGIDDLDTIARINWELNDLGLDTIEVGASLGVAAEAGVCSFGDREKVLSLVDEIRSGTEMGKLLASGASRTGEALGVEHVPAVKRQAMPAYDPRALQVIGVTYATSAQGADHTAGMTLRDGGPEQSARDLVQLSFQLQIQNAALDSLGACLFAGGVIKANPDIMSGLLKSCLGKDFGSNYLETIGKHTLHREQQFNQQAGFSPADDRIPTWMKTTPVPPTGKVFNIPNDLIDEMGK